MTHSDQLHYFRDAFELFKTLLQIMKSGRPRQEAIVAADYSYYSWEELEKSSNVRKMEWPDSAWKALSHIWATLCTTYTHTNSSSREAGSHQRALIVRLDVLAKRQVRDRNCFIIEKLAFMKWIARYWIVFYISTPANTICIELIKVIGLFLIIS